MNSYSRKIIKSSLKAKGKKSSSNILIWFFAISALIVAAQVAAGNYPQKEGFGMVGVFVGIASLNFFLKKYKTNVISKAPKELVEELETELENERLELIKKDEHSRRLVDTSKNDCVELSEEDAKAAIHNGTKDSGKVVLEEWFMTNHVRLYENGYIHLTMRNMEIPEKLVAISANTTSMLASSERVNGNTWAGAVLTVITERGPYQVKAITDKDDTYSTPERIATLEKIVLYAETLIDANKTKKRPRQESKKGVKN